MLVAQAVRSAREARGWSQDQLAERVNVTRSAISHLERSTRGASLDLLVALARELDLDIGFLSVTP